MVEPLTADVHGGGYWVFIHTCAVYQPNMYPQVVQFTKDHFFCEDCRQHFQTEITTLPVEGWTDNNIEGNSPAKHSWYLHNNVNRRLRKRQITWEQFKQLYVKNTPGAPVCEKCKTDLSSGATPKNPVNVLPANAYNTATYQASRLPQSKVTIKTLRNARR
jgi:hypothetical protein